MKTRRKSARANQPKVTGETLPGFLTTTTKATGALFKVTDVVDNGPLMSGSFEIDAIRYHVSAFRHVAQESGLEYLSLALQAPLPENHTAADIAAQIRYHGKLFRTDKDKAKSHKAPAYSGFVTVLPCVGEQKHDDAAWREAPLLKLTGERRRSANGEARIALVMAPQTVEAEELPF